MPPTPASRTTTRTTTRRPEGRVALAAIVVAGVLVGATAGRASVACPRDGRLAMGTVLEVTVCGEASEERARDAFAIASALDAAFTTWAPDGDLIRLNRSAGGEGRTVPASLRQVLVESVRYWTLTEGAFDVSVGPLMRLWRDAGDIGREPTVGQVRDTLARVGSDKIELGQHDVVRLAHGGMSLDLGGIGKGFALDRIADRLREAGVTRAFLDFGRSSLLALGSPPGDDAWRVLVRHPDGAVLGVASLRDQAASISATFGSGVEIGGRPYGHIVDPRSGRPVEGDRLAFVVAPDATQAEALSKALIVLGADRGRALIERLDHVEALLVEAGAPDARTSGFDRAVAWDPDPG